MTENILKARIRLSDEAEYAFGQTCLCNFYIYMTPGLIWSPDENSYETELALSYSYFITSIFI